MLQNHLLFTPGEISPGIMANNGEIMGPFTCDITPPGTEGVIIINCNHDIWIFLQNRFKGSFSYYIYQKREIN